MIASGIGRAGVGMVYYCTIETEEEAEEEEEEEEEEREIQQRMYHKTLVSLTCGADM